VDTLSLTPSFNGRHFFSILPVLRFTLGRGTFVLYAFPFLNVRHDDHKGNGSGRL